MSNIPARSLLESITGYTQSGEEVKSSADRPIRLGTIEPYFTSGNPRVLLDGETTMGEKRYTWSSSYKPKGGDRVYLIPVGQSYIIAGKVATPVTVPQFIPLTMQSGWRTYDFDTAYYVPSVTRTSLGVVKLMGLAAGGTMTSGTLLTVLPEPFRPLSHQFFPALANGNAASLRVSRNGEIRLGETIANNSYISLDNITFNNNPSLTWSDHTLVNGWASTNTSLAQDGPLTAQYSVDSVGRVWHRGALTRSPAPAAESAVNAAIPAAMRSDYQLHYRNSGTANTNMDTTTDGVIRWKGGSGSSSVWSIDALMYPKAGTPFSGMSYSNGWTTNAPAQPPAQYWKDSDGLVHVRGLVRSGAVGAVITTLPVGYRPSKRILRAIVSADTSGRLDIAPDGNIIASQGSNAWFSLDGITFVAEQ